MTEAKLNEVIKRYTDNADYARKQGDLQGCIEFRELAEFLEFCKELLKLPIDNMAITKGTCRKAHEMFEDRLHCSCGLEWVITGHWNKYNYCPNCGAKAVYIDKGR